MQLRIPKRKYVELKGFNILENNNYKDTFCRNFVCISYTREKSSYLKMYLSRIKRIVRFLSLNTDEIFILNTPLDCQAFLINTDNY